jgi:hypothetical protein|tara:strand:- start:17377 stop:18687 length:1311 start_codon:yes stop_codon:yes gene_type:complete
MIQVRTQNFMDILRKKEDEDYTTGTEDIDDFREAEEAADEGVIQDDKGGEGVSGKELAEDKKRKKQKLEAAKEARAKNIRLWKKLLEEFSKHGDIKNENMGEIVVEFSRSFLIPKKTSASKVMNFYRTLVPTGLDERPTAEPELLDLFYEKETAESARDLNTRIDTLNVTEGAELLGDLKLNELEEKEYNGKKSLDILRDFLDAVSAIRGSALRGSVMTRQKLDTLNRLLVTGTRKAKITDVEDIRLDIEGKPLELDDEGDPIEPEKERGYTLRGSDKELAVTKANLDTLLESFRIIIIVLSKVKRNLEKDVKKSINSEDTNYEFDSTKEALFYENVDFQRAREKTSRISILPEETTDSIDYLIDKLEEIYRAMVEFIENAKDADEEITRLTDEEITRLKQKAEKNKRVMENLVDTMIGSYEFPVENNKKRAIKIN